MTKTAVIYRMVMPDHTCSWGLKARHLLKSRGYKVEDHWLTTREQTDAFKAEHGVKTTPQVFIDGQRVGGHDDRCQPVSRCRLPSALVEDEMPNGGTGRRKSVNCWSPRV